MRRSAHPSRKAASEKPEKTLPIDFLSPVSVIRGFGPKKVSALNESGIETVGDLLYLLPRRYVDRSAVAPLSGIADYLNRTCTVVGRVKKARVERGRRSRLRVLLSDETGEVELIWFAGVPIYRNMLAVDARVIVTGKVTAHMQMVHPIVEVVPEDGEGQGALFLPLYPIAELMREAGIGHRSLLKSVHWALDAIDRFPQLLPEPIVQKNRFPSLEHCLREIHQPTDPAKLDACRDRLRYEELYHLALTLRWSRRKFALPGRPMLPGDLPERFKKFLPFSLTPGQEQAIRTLWDEAASPRRMHRLLQGDVGCGKTVVAFLACLPALSSGYQVVWLAPTEVLALQTCKLLGGWLARLGFKIASLSGGTKGEERRRILSALGEGSLQVIVGTHALLQPAVKFKRLGMIVIDEQHKFGVRQRLALQEKDTASDLLLMSATPIPQTLAKTLYGDLDIVTIPDRPAGRSPVSTHLVPGNKREEMERFILTEIRERGVSAYYVVPRIDQDDESETTSSIDSSSARLFGGTLKGVGAACLHGRMGTDEKEKAIQSFAAGEIKLLLSTTVVEVGIDVPQATIMVIDGAERFGLAQLHQLRGRVGRGGAKSYCFLLAPPDADEVTMQRLSFFCRHHDGFKIAEMDLTLRGPGEVAGFRQTGWEELKIADILRDAVLFRTIQEEIEALLGK